MNDNGDAMGRPVGVAIDTGAAALLVADVGNAVWRVPGAPAEKYRTLFIATRRVR
jgi:glucose/arabinose dehydrogenase